MQKLINLDYRKLNKEYIEGKLENEAEGYECLVPTGRRDIENSLREYGFNYSGIRKVEDEVFIVRSLFVKKGEHEDMAMFFDRRAKDYDEHMGYWKLSRFKEVTEKIICDTESPQILDLGCGTGGEIEYILKRNSSSLITCVDLSGEMLNILKENYKDTLDNIKIVCDSYTDMSFKKDYYNYVVACSTLHHLTKEIKQELLIKVHSSLKKGGYLLVMDYIVSPEEEEKRLRNYFSLIEEGQIDENRFYHIDLMMSAGTECELLKNAGFREIKFRFWDEGIVVICAMK